MPTLPEAIIDTLNGLLEAEVNSIFCFVMSGSPFLSDAAPQLQDLMKELDHACHQQRKEMVELIESVGGTPKVKNRVPDEEQYLSYLSLKFLVPKLVSEKELILKRFENARLSMGTQYPEVANRLGQIEARQRHYLEMLKSAVVDLPKAKAQPAPLRS